MTDLNSKLSTYECKQQLYLEEGYMKLLNIDPKRNNDFLTSSVRSGIHIKHGFTPTDKSRFYEFIYDNYELFKADTMEKYLRFLDHGELVEFANISKEHNLKIIEWIKHIPIQKSSKNLIHPYIPEDINILYILDNTNGKNDHLKSIINVLRYLICEGYNVSILNKITSYVKNKYTFSTNFKCVSSSNINIQLVDILEELKIIDRLKKLETIKLGSDKIIEMKLDNMSIRIKSSEEKYDKYLEYINLLEEKYDKHKEYINLLEEKIDKIKSNNPPEYESENITYPLIK